MAADDLEALYMAEPVEVKETQGEALGFQACQ